MGTVVTVGMADAKTNFSRITAEANRTGVPVTVFRHNRPWVEIRPLDVHGDVPAETMEAVAQADAIEADPEHVTYATAESVFEALDI
ncbi:hypothetical protein QJ043_00970 [Olsenella sp. YH-ols2217]|uniref:Antitoxin n=1 Tax=Kribbibacterium absianum TaxID=3044210 RepID=A0ABT6ZHX8_9ACTN|nr:MULTISPECIES: hypothetical protein [unclassified Olsenella]MDJ1121168.1 hypothetical protein [Olsenella sp. YH-ols2216]MDJ1128659.1 hypothetical protein [Olsenella sp. YH-ols2217]